MARDFSNNNLLKSVKLRGAYPQNSGLTDDMVLQWATEESELYVTSLLKGAREEYLIVTQTIPITGSTVAVPGRAAAGGLRQVTWQQGGNSGSFRQLVRVEPESSPDWASSLGAGTLGYAFRGDNLILYPKADDRSSSGSFLAVSYIQRLGQLVPVDQAGRVTAVSGTTLTLDSFPTAFDTGATYDVVSGVPNFSTHGIDLTVSAVDQAAKTLTFSDPFAIVPQVGDWIALAGQSPVPQIPYELHTLLAQRVAYKIAESYDSQRAPALKAGLDQAERQVLRLITPRDSSSVRIIRSKWGAGSGRMGPWFW